MMNKPFSILLVLILVTLAACGGDDTAPAAELPTRVDIPTSTPSDTPTVTPTPLASFTSSPTPTATATTTGTATVTPSATITETATRTPTATATFTLTPEPTVPQSGVGLLLTLAAQFTPLPTQYQVVAPVPTAGVITPTVVGSPGNTSPTICQFQPPGGFGTVYLSDTTLAGQLGCPVGSPPVTASILAASQTFERGQMIYTNNPPGVIYVLNNDGTFQRFDDTYNAATDPVSGGETAPAGLQEPVRGFGKVWRTAANVRTALGWATAAEQGTQATALDFANGRMLFLPTRGDILVLFYSGGSPAAGTWRAVPGRF